MANRSRRRHPRSSDSPLSDEYLTALTRGFYVPLSEDTRPKHKETYEAGGSFEETFPRYPFSTLVRIVLKLVEWISRRRSSVERTDRYGRGIHGLHR